MSRSVEDGKGSRAGSGTEPSRERRGPRGPGSLWVVEAGRLVRDDEGPPAASAEEDLEERLRRLEEGLEQMARELGRLRWEPIHLTIEPVL